MNRENRISKIFALLIIVNIYIFSLVEVKAYYSFDRNQSVSFSTAAYTNLSITTDKTTYGMCNKNAEINLTINNPNNYNINYTISINDSNLTYTIDGTSSSSYTMIKNGTNTHKIVLSGTTSNSSINIIVNVTSPYSSSYNKSINLDLVCPTCVFESPSQTTFLNGDTFAYTLTCTDASGIATPTLASSALTISNSSAFSITSITSTSITNGYKYTINAKAGSFNGEASISLKAGMVFDENGNSNVSVKSSNIKINNSVIVTFDPNGGSVTTNTKAVNYNSAYGELPIPTRSGYRFDGWYTSATGGTVVNNATIVTNASAHTLYAHWSDIEAPVCTFGSFGNSSLNIGETTNIILTCTDNEEITTSTLTSNAFTLSSTGVISISNITSSSITNGIKYIITVTGGTVTGSSTISLNAGSISDTSGNVNVKATSPSISNIADQTPPVITFNPDGNLTYAKSQSSAVTVTDQSDIAIMKYLWTQTNGTSAASGTSFTNNSTLSKATGDGTWYLCVYAKDIYNNEANECSNAFYLDNTSPTITFETEHLSETLKSHTVNVGVSDMAPITSAKYLWSTTSSGNPKTNGTAFSLTNGEANITKNTGSGQYYLCVYAEDIAGNSNTSCYQALNFDNDGPVITTNTICTRLNESVPVGQYISATDISGVVSIQASKTPNGTYINNLSELDQGIQTVYFKATDSLGNVSSPKAVTVSVYMNLAEDINVITSGDGLYNVSGRKIYKGTSPNNYITFNGETWRIISIESDGRIKIRRNDLMPARAYGGTANKSLKFTTSTIYTYLQNDYWNSLSATAQSMVDTNSKWGVGSYKGYIDGSSSVSKVSTYISDEAATKATFNVGMYTMSDYFYASRNSSCTGSLNVSGLAKCANDNWNKNGTGGNVLIMNAYTYEYNNYYRALAQTTGNKLTTVGLTSTAPYYPAVYLKSGLSFVGSGTEADPYQINTTCLQSPLSCTITLNETNNGSSNEQSDYSLSFTTSTTDPSATVNSFNWSTGATTNTAPISTAGNYQLFLIDSSGRKSSCSIAITSEKQYRTRRCNYTWSNWWKDNSCKITRSVSSVWHPTKSEAEANNKSKYYVACNHYIDPDEGIHYYDHDCYRRSCTKNQASCNNYSWSAWGTTSATESCGTDVQTRTVLSD